MHDWFDGAHDSFCFTFVRDLAPEEALRRTGAQPYDEEEWDEDDFVEGLITAEPVEGGTLLVEDNGFAGTLDTVQRPLSAGTVTAAVFRNVNHDQVFVYWEDGVEILSFDPQFPAESRAGADPGRFLPLMTELGLIDADGEDGADAGVHRALALAQRLTGLSVGEEIPEGEQSVRGVLEHY
ncbi:DUF6461 domain-containing protein [Nonomuraea sp. NPDC049152]|uniref:DUF6461 domain-containing protein n=1 Tax=Nonomuraea sp. NPDC049152 TaxID=3154350 RepID=UPI0033EAD3AE